MTFQAKLNRKKRKSESHQHWAKVHKGFHTRVLVETQFHILTHKDLSPVLQISAQVTIFHTGM